MKSTYYDAVPNIRTYVPINRYPIQNYAFPCVCTCMHVKNLACTHLAPVHDFIKKINTIQIYH